MWSLSPESHCTNVLLDCQHVDTSDILVLKLILVLVFYFIRKSEFLFYLVLVFWINDNSSFYVVFKDNFSFYII